MIPNEAIVVRGGRNLPDDIRRGSATHRSGATGLSVECSEVVPLVELAAVLPHGRIGVATVGRIRAAGGDVIRTSGRSPNHATVVGLTPEVASGLFTPTIPNPARL